MKTYVIGVSPLGPSRKVKAAIRRAVKDINAPQEDALVRLERFFYSRYGTTAASLLFANTLKELFFIITANLHPKKVVIAGPADSVYREAAASAWADTEIIQAAQENFFQPDLRRLVEKAEGAELVFLANPNRITGNVLSASVLNQIMAALSMKDCTVVIDESLIEFSEGEGLIRQAAKSNNVIVLRTTSAYYGLPGLELAYAVSGPKMIASLRREICSEVNLLSLEAASEAFRDKTYNRISGKFMADEKRLFMKKFGGMSGVTMYASDTNVFLLKMPEKANRVADAAAQSGLAVRSCRDIEGLDDTFLRVSVMGHDHNLKLIKLIGSVCAGEDKNKSETIGK